MGVIQVLTYNGQRYEAYGAFVTQMGCKFELVHPQELDNPFSLPDAHQESVLVVGVDIDLRLFATVLQEYLKAKWRLCIEIMDDANTPYNSQKRQDQARRLFGGYGVLVVSNLHTPSLLSDVCEFTTPALTEREVQVLQLVAEGMTNRQIGSELGLSHLTIKSHLMRIGKRLGTGNRVKMVILAMRSGIIQ